MESLSDTINRLGTAIQALEKEKQDLATTDEMKISYNTLIAAKQETLNIYLKSQQGKFASPISVVLSHSYRSHIFAHSLSTSSLHPSRFGKYAR